MRDTDGTTYSTNAGLLSIASLGTNFKEILLKTKYIFLSRNCIWKCPGPLWNVSQLVRLQCVKCCNYPMPFLPHVCVILNSGLLRRHWRNHGIELNSQNITKLDMSTAYRRLKSPRSLSGTSTHPTMVRQVKILVMNGWLTSFSFIVNRSPHSWDKATSDSDLYTPRSRSWVWSKGKVIQSAQYHINSLLFISHQSDQQFRR